MKVYSQNPKIDTTVSSYSYSEYMGLVTQFVKHEITSGLSFDPFLVQTTKLNLNRMKRLNKTVVISDELIEKLKNLKHIQNWIVLTEAWCGDGAQNLPGIAKLAACSNGKINLQIIFRDNNPDFMNQYLTNGGKAIPKLIARNNKGLDLFTWGPRPQKAVDIVTHWNENKDAMTKEEMHFNLHDWYNKDKCQCLINELEQLIDDNI